MIDVNPLNEKNNSLLNSENKIKILEIIPHKLLITDLEFDEINLETLKIKNLKDFPININVSSSDTKKIEVKPKEFRLNPYQTQILTLLIFVK